MAVQVKGNQELVCRLRGARRQDSSVQNVQRGKQVRRVVANVLVSTLTTGAAAHPRRPPAPHPASASRLTLRRHPRKSIGAL